MATSKRVAKVAGKQLDNPRSPTKVKQVAASALSSVPDKKGKNKGK